MSSSAPYEQITESGDLTSTFSFSDKSIRHGSTDYFIMIYIAVLLVLYT